ncbi:ArsR/SmtB family transcription factor [Ramlibacter tataouinensis]|uniref:Transcriptional regulator, ArsR family-like protein n=1 Tax=Ramlibacter tataouinensis (strain ATCC BAA-407 / DSM 14655 / LMG 21543 / TTB310) TaxID=365046 RepID=F5XZ75_RAMTT|nr:metalloregulator ArsR/SmtB family transcription factor [Ramlibacter tataouinensis]AEG93245.1 transcriptional regulator, ArsR family-like protein [Ramlibacter tataouinensis TTB310]
MRGTPDPGQLDRQFFALSDTTRRTILEHLSNGPASVTELTEPLGIAMPSVVKHLTVLEDGGLVQSEKAGRVRTYRMTPSAYAAIEQWVAMRRKRLDAKFDRLDRYLSGGKMKEPPR